MKKQTILLLIFGLYSTCKVCGQCVTDSLFPGKIGMTKFKIINALSLKDNIYELEEFLNYWVPSKYIKGDSINESQVNFKFGKHQCIKSSDNVCLLSFSNDSLNSMEIKIWFDPKDFKKCLENYNQIFESLKNEFHFHEDFNSYNETKEQIGEGYFLYHSVKERHKEGSEMVSIGYEIEYVKKWDVKTKQIIKTVNIDKYLLTINIYKIHIEKESH